ncbi:MAG: molybdenum cofactor biosynthesis protein MoaE [Candidatus Sericytochromatia bacterium]
MIAVWERPLELEPLLAAVSDPAVGAISTFAGVVRNHNLGRPVLYLEYEGYTPMVVSELAKIAAEVKERWPVHALAVVHRLGRLEIGETAVLIAVSSAHRQASIEALHFTIDTLKQRVPIWKKEYWTDGSMWLENCCA